MMRFLNAIFNLAFAVGLLFWTVKLVPLGAEAMQLPAWCWYFYALCVSGMVAVMTWVPASRLPGALVLAGLVVGLLAGTVLIGVEEAAGVATVAMANEGSQFMQAKANFKPIFAAGLVVVLPAVSTLGLVAFAMESRSRKRQTGAG